MPNEAQLKAQMQAAIAKKKQQAEPKVDDLPKNDDPSPTPSDKPKTKEAITPPSDNGSVLVTNLITKPLPEKKPESSNKPTVTNPTALTFFGQAIRFTTHRGHVYFSIDDVLPLSSNAEAQNRYIEFKNQPSTREKAESLIKNVTFTGENGSEKLDSAKSTDVIKVLVELKLSCPGPLGDWLNQISLQYKPEVNKNDDDNEEE